jgi:hypothetical protein
MQRQFVLFSAALLASFAISSTAHAADDLAASDEQKVLDRWVGNWHSTYRAPQADWTPIAKEGAAELATRRVLRGQFVQETTQHSDKTTAMVLLTYEAQPKRYRAWWFNSKGQTKEYTGRWDGDAKTMTWTSVGQPPTTIGKNHFVDDDHMEWEVTAVGPGGKELFRLEGKNVRKEGAKP